MATVQSRFQVICDTRGCMGNGNENIYATEADAIAAWNSRAPDLERDELREALSAANYYVALYEAEHESNIALDVYTRAARALAGKGVKR